MPYIAPEVITEAKRMDLLTYLREYEPGELVKFSSNTYTTRTHDSLKISNGKWMWWSRGIGGKSALDYLIKVRGMDFVGAVQTIMGNGSVSFPTCENIKSYEEQPLLLPQKSPTTDVVFDWYCDTTNTIDYELNPDFDSDSFLFAFEDTDMNDHQKEIVAQLWGIYTGKPMSKKEVAENMGVTYNRIRQVEICCLRHILRNRNRNTLIKEK